MIDEENTLDVGPLGPPPEEKPIRFFAPQSVRALLAFAAIFLFAIISISGLLAANFGNWPNTKELLEIVLPPLTAIVSGVIGFFYGSNRG